MSFFKFSYVGHKLNGHHLLEFSTSIDNQTSLSLSKLKIRVATLWVMFGASSDTNINDRTFSNEVVQLHHLSSKKLHQHSPANVNTILLKKLHNQSRRKRKKRKRKEDDEISSNLYYFKNHSYNHITTDNNNGDHIIKSNSNEERRRRKVKSIDIIGSNKLSRSRTKRKENHHEKNITLWIFRIKKPVDRLNGTINIDDNVKRSSFLISVQSTLTFLNVFLGIRQLSGVECIKRCYIKAIRLAED